MTAPARAAPTAHQDAGQNQKTHRLYPYFPKPVVFSDGTQVAVQHYELRDKLVVFETAEGKLHFVNRAYVDLDAMEQINRRFLLGRLPPS